MHPAAESTDQFIVPSEAAHQAAQRWPWQQHHQARGPPGTGVRSMSELTLQGETSLDTQEKAPRQDHLPRPEYASQQQEHAADVGIGGITAHPGIFLTVVLLVFIGLRPARLEAQLRTKDGKAWEDFRDKLISRWETVLVTVGLVLSTAGTVIFSDKAHSAAYVAAVTSFCSAIISITFGTGLGFVFKDAPGETFMALVKRPILLLVILASPTVFAVGSMFALYASIVCIAFQDLDTELANILVRIGTTGGAVLMAIMFFASAYLVRGLERADKKQGRVYA